MSKLQEHLVNAEASMRKAKRLMRGADNKQAAIETLLTIGCLRQATAPGEGTRPTSRKK